MQRLEALTGDPGDAAQGEAEEEEGRLYSDVMEALSDPLFDDYDIRNTDVRDLVEVSPESARALLRVCDAYQTTLTDARSLAASANNKEYAAPFAKALHVY